MSIFLSKEELTELTDKKISTSQRKALNFMGVEHKIRPDGSVAVLRSHVVKVFGGEESRRKKKPIEPNWGAMN